MLLWGKVLVQAMFQEAIRLTTAADPRAAGSTRMSTGALTSPHAGSSRMLDGQPSTQILNPPIFEQRRPKGVVNRADDAPHCQFSDYSSERAEEVDRSHFLEPELGRNSPQVVGWRRHSSLLPSVSPDWILAWLDSDHVFRNSGFLRFAISIVGSGSPKPYLDRRISAVNT